MRKEESRTRKRSRSGHQSKAVGMEEMVYDRIHGEVRVYATFFGGDEIIAHRVRVGT